MRHSWGFVAAIAKEWIAIMSGVVSLGIAIALARSGKTSIPSNVYWAIGMVTLFVALFVASYRAWSAKNREVIELKRKFEPGIKATILGVSWGLQPGLPGLPGSAMAVVKLRIKNLGAPTIADLFSVTVDTGTRLFSGQNVLPPPPDGSFEMLRPEGLSVMKYEEFIGPKTAMKPIATGSQIGGVMLAEFEDLNPLEIERSKVIVRFHDIYDQEHSTVYDVAPGRHFRGHTTHPGIDSPADT
jgi:hypothetical protein